MIPTRALMMLAVAVCSALCVSAAAFDQRGVHTHAEDVEVVEVGPGRKMLSMGWGWSWSDKLAYLEEKGFTCKKHGKSGRSWVCTRYRSSNSDGGKGSDDTGSDDTGGDDTGGDDMPGPTPSPGRCGMGGQPVCSGDQLNGRQFECDYGYVGMDGMCVTYGQKAKEEQQPEPTQQPAPEPTPQPAPEPTPQPAPEPTPQPAPEPTPQPSPDPMPATQPTTPPPEPTPAPSPPSGRSGAVADNIGMATTGCGDPMVQEMVAADNGDRGGAGSLQCNDAISKLALEHSKSQCNRRKMDHDSGDGRFEEVAAMGYRTRAENVLYNMDPMETTVAKGHASWMGSPGHHANIMNPNYDSVGYGYYVCEVGPTGARSVDRPVIYMTGIFAGDKQ